MLRLVGILVMDISVDAEEDAMACIHSKVDSSKRFGANSTGHGLV